MLFTGKILGNKLFYLFDVRVTILIKPFSKIIRNTVSKAFKIFNTVNNFLI